MSGMTASGTQDERQVTVPLHDNFNPIPSGVRTAYRPEPGRPDDPIIM
jgi:hypothetical protein